MGRNVSSVLQDTGIMNAINFNNVAVEHDLEHTIMSIRLSFRNFFLFQDGLISLSTAFKIRINNFKFICQKHDMFFVCCFRSKRKDSPQYFHMAWSEIAPSSPTITCPKPSMGLVYSPIHLVDIYGRSRYIYNIYIYTYINHRWMLWHIPPLEKGKSSSSKVWKGRDIYIYTGSQRP